MEETLQEHDDEDFHNHFVNKSTSQSFHKNMLSNSNQVNNNSFQKMNTRKLPVSPNNLKKIDFF